MAKNKDIKLSVDIISTLKEKPNIKEIHIDVDGTVHFNVFDEIKTVKDKKTGKESKVNTGNKISGGKKKLIVQTISREDALKLGAENSSAENSSAENSSAENSSAEK